LAIKNETLTLEVAHLYSTEKSVSYELCAGFEENFQLITDFFWYFLEYDMNEHEILPEGWIKVRHVSGIFVYVHKPTRVVTLSRPYNAGCGNLRHHKIPLFSLPCLAYRTLKASFGAPEVRTRVLCSLRQVLYYLAKSCFMMGVHRSDTRSALCVRLYW
uniref:DUF4708 domain-containing protein n=1 Tax=Schistocephalus solidus TaxID=70667 RepID=A0A183TBA0_SCHSO